MALPISFRKKPAAAWIFLAFGITPFLINGFFAHPWTDDYFYSALSRDSGFISAWQYHYNHFNGRYFSISLVLINPLVYGFLWGYKLIPCILILGMLAAFLMIVSEIAKGSLSFHARITFSLALLFVYLDQMPDIRPGLYWMSGSLTYQIGAILLILFIALLLRMFNVANQPRIISTAALILLAACLPGTNEVILFLLLPALSLCLWYDLLHRKKVVSQLIVISAVIGIGAGCVLLAPGNSARLTNYAGNRDTLLAIQQSFEAASAAIAVWASTPLVILLTVIVIVTVYENQGLRGLFGGIHPLITVVTLFLLIIASFFPPYWSTGHYPERRVVNIIYLFFLLGWLANAAFIASRIPVGKQLAFSQPCKFLIYAIAAGYFVALLWLGHSNFILVAGDLLSGRSYKYDVELRDRYRKIRQNPMPHQQVDSLEHMPKSLFFADIYLNSGGWINQSYADYYRIESIIIKKPDLAPTSSPQKTE